MNLAARLGSTVLYQIYPQSYADSNGDGIGDLNGIRQQLDYLDWLGVDALWLNPCFVSPFDDAGYDVADFLQIAPRYGTNDDLAALCADAADRGIAVLLDLVAGHTSDRHPWFRAAIAPDADPAVRDRYIWTDTPRDGWPVPRDNPGLDRWYLPNFFEIQPALNFGYARLNPDEPWRQPVDAPGPRANRDALRAILSYWFDRGVSGFRVDMAASLVKDDPGLVETGRLWAEMRAWMDAEYPDRILISEWGNPELAVPAGFHVDFFLQFGGPTDGLALRSLWNNNGGTVDEIWNQDVCWADAEGKGEAATFTTAWSQAAAAISKADPQGRYANTGIIGFPTANHDFSRLVTAPRDATGARVALALVLTWPALPSLYYGDELGMRYVPGTPELEGSRLGRRYDRAGSRTPMQWGDPAIESRYLPRDPDPDAPTVAAARADENSLLHVTRRLIALRHADPRLHAGAPLKVLATGYPFAYTRGEQHDLLVVLNPSREPVSLAFGGAAGGTVLIGSGVDLAPEAVRLDGFGYALIDLA